uniref:Uncharacterized protein n=1 Tax=Chromera velia CCMP2878 TaxID=1169474 RepID=A0A0G4G4E4_9ALVE|eukprot:Cvel_20176.t1-p1 / transcript=Cvel_20176.t1 / gene=Cvel_20176 / organism=Chromera_velia_CCMP2878 / gene_product=hypothetical protein / transcript_product=hypothetical protein / location=Cvel_scaffold1793:16765-17058(+) / protein_length=98 / sequence_SO=supercontig / SO=protein_coding / is_pseudo=false
MCRRGGSEVGLQKRYDRGGGSRRGLAGVSERSVRQGLGQGGLVSKRPGKGLRKICAAGRAGLEGVFGRSVRQGRRVSNWSGRGLRKICAAGGAGLKGV